MSVRVIHPCFHDNLVVVGSEATTASHVPDEGVVTEQTAVDRVAAAELSAPSDVQVQSTDQSSNLAARLVAIDDHDQAWIDLGGEEGLVPACISFAATRAQLHELVTTRAQVIARGGSGTWHVEAIVGVVLPLAAPAEPLNQHLTVEADADGHRVRLCAEHEIVLACGKASITLRANGRVIIKGAQVESYALGTNRIKGGQVRIN